MQPIKPLVRLLVLITSLIALNIAQAQATVDVVIFRSLDSLTIYLPGTSYVNISGLTVDATTATGQNLRQTIDTLPAFRGLPFNSLPTPLCFHLTRTTNTPLPLNCQTITTITQTMVDADVFWYDLTARGDRTLIIYLGSSIQLCAAGSARCNLVFSIPPTPTPSPTPTATNTLMTTDVPGLPPRPTPVLDEKGNGNYQVDPLLATATAFIMQQTQMALFGQATPPPQIPFEFVSVTSNDEWEIITLDFDRITMVLVPAGCFRMGTTEEQAQYEINEFGATSSLVADEQPTFEHCFYEPFWIDRTEIAQSDFVRLNGVKENPNAFLGDERPVEQITWFEAQNFCALRGERINQVMRLPTEAEWEYAARGPDSFIYPWGNTWQEDNAVWRLNSNSVTADVGTLPENRSWVGALDMSGNVWEWVNTAYGIDLGGESRNDNFTDLGERLFTYPYNPADGREAYSDEINLIRVFRGGSFHINNPVSLRATVRSKGSPNARFFDVGFRCAMSYTPPQ